MCVFVAGKSAFLKYAFPVRVDEVRRTSRRKCQQVTCWPRH